MAANLVNAPATYKSAIWKHFGFESKTVDGKTETVKENTVCRICLTKVSYKSGNTSNMAFHMKRHHADVDLGSVATKQAEPQGQGQLRLSDFLKKKMPINSPRSKGISKALGRFLAKDMRPYSLVESGPFQDFVSTLEPAYSMPSRVYFSKTVVPELYEQTVSLVRDQLQSSKYVALTTDGWTSKATQSYVTVTAHCVDANWELKSFVLQTRALNDSHTAENLAKVLNEAVAEWNLQKFWKSDGAAEAIPIAITSDNAQNIVKAIDIAGFQPHIRCFAHCLNLSAQKAIDLPSVSRLLGRMRRVVTFFHQSTTASHLLKEKQKALDLPQHKLINDVRTRWNSSYDMASRYLEQQPAIYATLASKEIKKNAKDIVTLTDLDIEQIERLVEVLEPLKTMTTLMCEEKSPTVSMIHPLREKLLTHLQGQDTDTVMISQVKTAIREDVLSRYSDEGTKSFLEIASVLDPRFKSLPYHDETGRQQVYAHLETLLVSSNNKVSMCVIQNFQNLGIEIK